MAFGLLSLGAITMSALASSGCSDTVPPSAQGAVSYRIWKATGQTCSWGHSMNAPNLGRGQNVTSTGVGEVAVDGQGGAKVKCQVKPSGDSFMVTGELELGNIAFSIDATVAPGQTDAEAKVRLQDNITVSPYAQPVLLLDPPPAPCKVDVKAGKYGVDAGWVWGHFSCNAVVDERSPDAVCSAEGTFIFENCDE